MKRSAANDDSYELMSYKREAKTAARQLFYGDRVIRKIERAKTVAEITRIMKQARLDKQWRC